MPKKKEVSEVNTIDMVCKQLQKKMGDNGSIICLDESFVLPEIEVIDTGICTLNEALGVWGWPIGRIIELWGPPSSGKTSLSLLALAQAQKAFPDKKVAVIDCEHSFDKNWAELLGLNVSEIVFSQPDSMENSLDIVEALSETGLVSMIMVDSVSAMTPKAELEGDMDSTHIGLHARLMSKSLRKIKGKAYKTGTTILFINQVRHGIGPFAGEQTSGGNSLKFYASIRIRVRRLADIVSGDKAVGIQIAAQTKKNKVAAPYKVAIVPLYFDLGFSNEAALVKAAIDHGIITKKASWFYYEEQKFQGEENLAAILRENKELTKEIEEKYKRIVRGEKIIEIGGEKSV